MAKIKFENGMTVNFDETPTQQDIDEVWRSVSKPKQQKIGLLDRISSITTSRFKGSFDTGSAIAQEGFGFGRSGAEDVVGAVTGKPTFDPRTGEFKETPKGLFNRLGQGGLGVAKVISGAVESSLGGVAGGALGFFKPEGKALAKVVGENLSESDKTALKEDLTKVVTDFTKIKESFSKEDQEGIRALTSMLGLGATKAATPAVKSAIKSGVTGFAERSGVGIKNLLKRGKTLFTTPAKSIDDVIRQADEALPIAKAETTAGVRGATDDVLATGQPKTASAIRGLAEADAPAISVTEKWAGVRPDIKKRISGKQDKLQEYFDIAHSRNLDDTLPTPLEWGAKNTEKARDVLRNTLNDTGSEIGAFRRSIATKQIPDGGMVEVRNSFVNELNKLNLTTNNAGDIVRMSAKVKKASDSEIKLLQSLFEDMQTVRDVQTMENLIDLRNVMQNNINFAKSAKEASNVVDPLSRAVRSKIRDINIKAIGVDQAKLLDDYSDLIGLLEELNKFVDSKSGGEFLLKRVLSERGRIPREVIEKLKEITGIDLMDDAVMAQLATEIIGNPAQKGLFQQEITRAGLNTADVLNLISKRPGVGAIELLLEKGKKALAPIEEMFLKAAEPIVKPKKSLKDLLKDTKGSARFFDDLSDTKPLATQAKKFKSADEFVKAQTPVYHGSPEPLKEFEKRGAFFTEEYADATGFAGSPDNVYEGYLNFKKPLIIDANGRKWDDIASSHGTSTQEIISNVEKTKEYDGVIFKNVIDNIADDAESGIPGSIYYPFDANKSFINESQLTDIWNKANK